MKKKLIDTILQTIAANGQHISGELFFTLAFRSESELVAIAKDLHINVENL